MRDCDWKAGKEYDFLSDSYPYIDNIDYIIMNPPYSVAEPFLLKSLAIANKGVLMLARLQFLEGEKRFLNIFNQFSNDRKISLCPDDVYVYVDRIYCYKNGDTNEKQSSAQAYAWFYWNCDFTANYKETKLHWIRRANKSR